MPAPTTIPDYLDCVRRSGVVEDDRLNAYITQLESTDSCPAELPKLATQMVHDGILTRFQSEQFLQGKWKRFHIGKYKVLERLGSGGMGQVFLCEHKLMRRLVAIKVLPTVKAEDPAAKERFYREARAVAALDHPNVVRAFDVDQDGALHFIVLEHIDGSSLQDIVKKHGLMDPLRACHYIHQAAIGLDYAHQVAGIIHRDIKPGNIVVDRTGVVKLLDMGLAKFFREEGDAVTQKYDDNVLGTADYLAPEQALDSSAVDIRADIYSLGATFYYLLSGRPPFPDGSAAQKLVWHQMKEPTSLKDLVPQLSDDIVSIVQRMMKKAPDERYSLPSEVAEALAPLTTSPIPPPPDREMPQHSLAALAGATTAGTNPRAAAARQPGIRNSSIVSLPASSGIFPRPTSSRLSLTLPLTASRPHFPVDEPPPAPTPENPFSLLFSGRASDIENKTSSALIENVYSGNSHSQPAEQHSQRRPRRQTSWAYGLFGLLAGGVMILSWWIQHSAPTVKAASTEKAAPFTGRTLTVDPEGNSDYRRVLDAVRRAQPGDRIIIKSPAIQELLQLDELAGDRGDFWIESGLPDGRPILWTPPPNVSPTSHLVELANVGNVRLRNIVFDGQGRIGTPIRIAGNAPGTHLERLHLRGFTKGGIQLADCYGESERPISITSCRLQSTYNGAVGIRLGGTNLSRPMKSVKVSDCSFEGSLESAVAGEGSAVDLSFENNRIYRANDGFRWRRFEADHALRAKLAGNTFVDLKNAAVHFESAPPNFDESIVTFERSLGIRTGALLRIDDDGKPWFVKANHNWRDAVTRDGDLNPPARVESVNLSTDPTARDFLRYPRGHRLSTAADGAPVGSPPLD